MKTTIENHLALLAQAIQWVNTYLEGDRKRNAYNYFVNCRRRLKKIQYAIEENRAVVAYGQSQAGKSYLVSSLLSNSEKPFAVFDESNNKEIDFITDINPRGNKTESTGLVTRFTLNKQSDFIDYPVRVKLMSVTDIIIVLCDTYYNDVSERSLLKLDEVKNRIAGIQADLENEVVCQDIITEDDVLDVKDYFDRYFPSDTAAYLKDAEYLQEISLLIEKAHLKQWPDIFSVLWNDEEQLTLLFRNYITYYSQLNFAKEVFVNYDVLLRDNGTLLDVALLRNLNDSKEISIRYYDKSGKDIIKNFHKSFLCAMAAEVVLKLPEELSDNKQFLKTTDILDFPGARARKNKNKVTSDLIPEMLIRGKVAYYFNKYSANLKINNLLFCHGIDNFEIGYMPTELERWIKSFVGETPIEREEFMGKAQIPPLFFICTMFNLDLKHDQNDRPGRENSFNTRWNNRFHVHYKEEIFGLTNEWLNNWTTSIPDFQNFYLLRDFYYSSEKENNIFRGWSRPEPQSDKYGSKEIDEIVPDEYPAFRRDLKDSFLKHDFVNTHFADPEYSWDEAASVNKDGTDLIIKNLTIASNSINQARDERFQRELNVISTEIVKELERYYHSNNSNDNLQKAKTKAGEVQAALDIAYGRDHYYFGKMMQYLTIKEDEVYRIFHAELNEVNITKKKDLGKYVFIRLKASNLSPTLSFDENLAILANAYEMNVNACKVFFEEQQVNLKELFETSDNGVKSVSVSLAELITDYWFDTWLRKTNIKNLSEMLGASIVNDFIDMLWSLYYKLDICGKIARQIRKYVDKFGSNIDEIQEMVADMSAEIINCFVLSIGYDYFSNDSINALKQANITQNLGLNFDYEKLNFKANGNNDIAYLYETMDNLSQIINEQDLDVETIKFVPGYHNRIKWSEQIKIGFIQTQDIPNYDLIANNQLGEIKNLCATIKYN